LKLMLMRSPLAAEPPSAEVEGHTAVDGRAEHVVALDGAVSGPLHLPKLYNGKNRTFFLGTFGAFLQSGGQPTVFRNVPTADMYGGDFSFGGQGLPVTLTVQRYGEVNDPRMGHRIAYSADRFQVECTCGQVVYGPTTRTAHLVKAQRAHEKAVA
jgi:hypothetical protein